ncbi:MAG: HAD-IIB family hydrolase [Patescibacteria group bacterium]
MLGIDLISWVQFLGYPGLFAIIFLESGVFFGFFLPGASLLFIAGMLASLNVLNVWVLIPLLFAAAVLGDNVGYWFGSYIGKAIYKRPNSRFFRQEHVRLAHDFFEKYGKAAVLLARFVPIARTFTPILAGVGRMNYKTFLFFNILGAIVWACGVTLLGYFIGRYVPDAEHYLTLIIAGIIGITTLPIFIHWWQKSENRKRMNMRRPHAAIFDLDNTLAMAFMPLPEKSARGVAALLKIMPVAIMSGASIERMEKYILPALPANAKLDNLYLFPDTCARCYVWKNGQWRLVFNHTLSKEEYYAAVTAIKEGIDATSIVKNTPVWGERMLARENQVTFAGLGIDAPADKKKEWDRDRSKRAPLKKFLDERLAKFDLDVRISSRTAIDITKKGVDKALGVRWFAEHLKIKPQEMLFVGDALGPEGNDAIVIPTGIETREVKNPEETAKIIDEILAT